MAIYCSSFRRVLLNFQYPGPLGHLFGKDKEMCIASWSGAIAEQISVFFTLSVRFLAIRKKSILDLTFQNFDSYVNFGNFGWHTP